MLLDVYKDVFMTIKNDVKKENQTPIEKDEDIIFLRKMFFILKLGFLEITFIYIRKVQHYKVNSSKIN